MNKTDITLNPRIYSFLLAMIKYVRPLGLTPMIRFVQPIYSLGYKSKPFLNTQK